jgi:hypothetical protein
MQDSGLDEGGYDDLFAAFHEQTRKLVAQVVLEGGEFPKAGLAAFADDATSLCGQGVSKRLSVLAETGPSADCSNYLQHLLHELDQALERRTRIKARLSGQE